MQRSKIKRLVDVRPPKNVSNLNVRPGVQKVQVEQVVHAKRVSEFGADLAPRGVMERVPLTAPSTIVVFLGASGSCCLLDGGPAAVTGAVLLSRAECDELVKLLAERRQTEPTEPDQRGLVDQA